ncbi:adenylate/guanylate cyclase domain-containing protein [Motiliproteus coralliicola]|uniref:Adenylate/guanylate cyclase domain-containing protein n=1 Tax=Motiliproteus coralliicola TaxID=2283196 RepID=A0A369WZI1_9GAMM|nr:adenylate/guanylate cyclase domain-containing protein [Motiliproteus coralliicola]RDE24925.1 adenylate/guanylate cyclase domain-containing protein [Motiliproteus coralliicola]
MLQQTRLYTGLIIAAFVIPHLLNHSVGLISLTWMEAALEYFIGFWHHPVATLMLYGSVLTHFLLALWSLYHRTTLRMPFWQLSQLVLGLSIPPLILAHVIGARLSHELLGTTATYEATVQAIWNSEYGVLRQTSLVLVVWIHLMLGLHYWLRLKPDYRRWIAFWQLLATLVPLLALMGFYRVGLTLADQAVEPAAASGYETGIDDSTSPAAGGYDDYGGYEDGYPSGAVVSKSTKTEVDQTLDWVRNTMPLVFWGSLTLTLVLRGARLGWSARRARVRVRLPAQNQLRARQGQTLLEALREAGIEHSSVCGGRGRCTTCRVRIMEGLDQLPPADDTERQALEGVQADDDVRLACQLRLTSDLSVVPLIPYQQRFSYLRKPGGVEGIEQQVTVLFIDLRGSTALAEARLPYDVVFILNQFFAEMASALEETDGHYAQFNGDGLMALYGLDGDFEQGARQAIRGAQRMLHRLDGINQRLEKELQQPLRVGIGIHSGEAIVGTMGPPSAPIRSALGDTVNTAARLEGQTKHLGVPLLLSRHSAEVAGLALETLEQRQLPLRGRDQLLDVILVKEPAKLAW